MRDWLWIIGGLALWVVLMAAVVGGILFILTMIDWHQVAQDVGSLVRSFQEGMEP